MSLTDYRRLMDRRRALVVHKDGAAPVTLSMAAYDGKAPLKLGEPVDIDPPDDFLHRAKARLARVRRRLRAITESR